METGNTLKKPTVRCLLALLCCALWGSAFPCVKIGYEWLDIQSVGSQILFAGYRFFLAGVLTFFAGCLLEKRFMTIRKESVLHVAGIGFLQTTVQYVCFYIAMSHITGTKGSIINASNAFVSILLAHFLIKGERMTWKKGAGCLIGFAGVVLINAEGISGGVSFMGEGMMILCTIVYGSCSVLMKLISHRGTAMAITAWQLLFGGFLLIVIGFASGGRISGFDGKSAALLLYMAALSAAAFSIWTALLKYNPVGKVTIFGFSIPVFGVILSGIFLGESFLSVQSLSALACVSAGIVLVNLPGGRKRERLEASDRVGNTRRKE